MFFFSLFVCLLWTGNAKWTQRKKKKNVVKRQTPADKSQIYNQQRSHKKKLDSVCQVLL